MDILDMERAGTDYSDNRGERKIIYLNCCQNLLALDSTSSPESSEISLIVHHECDMMVERPSLRIKQKQPEDYKDLSTFSFKRSFSLKCSILKPRKSRTGTSNYSFFARFMHLQLKVSFHHFSFPVIYRAIELALARINSFTLQFIVFKCEVE